MHGSSALISLVLAEGGNTLIWTWDAGDLLLFKHAQDYVRLLTKNRTTAAFIAFGGFNVAAALGDADCGSGLLVQAPKLRHIVTAVGSSGTWRAWCARFWALTQARSVILMPVVYAVWSLNWLENHSRLPCILTATK